MQQTHFSQNFPPKIQKQQFYGISMFYNHKYCQNLSVLFREEILRYEGINISYYYTYNNTYVGDKDIEHINSETKFRSSNSIGEIEGFKILPTIHHYITYVLIITIMFLLIFFYKTSKNSKVKTQKHLGYLVSKIEEREKTEMKERSSLPLMMYSENTEDPRKESTTTFS